MTTTKGVKMIAYHGKQAVKDVYVNRVNAHALADEIVQGTYWENGKGCAVGCTLHSDDHTAYERELGVPIIMARLEDRIFEGLSNGKARAFPLRFLSAIQPGADLSMVWPKFAVWLLTDKKYGVLRPTKKGSAQYIAIERVAALYRDLTDWDKRDKKAFAAAYAAAAAAAYAADAYAAAYAVYAAAAAADAAAADAYAADAAAAAAAAADAYAADAAARRKHFEAQSEKLLELLAEAPIST